MSSLRTHYLSTVQAYRSKSTFANGTPTISYVPITDMLDYYWNVPGQMQCKIDLLWTRPGKSQPPATMNAIAVSRYGTLFFDPYENPDDDFLGAGDYIQCISGPITGTFELRTRPEPAVNAAGIHHMETDIVEIDKQLAGIFPRATLL